MFICEVNVIYFDCYFFWRVLEFVVIINIGDGINGCFFDKYVGVNEWFVVFIMDVIIDELFFFYLILGRFGSGVVIFCGVIVVLNDIV